MKSIKKTSNIVQEMLDGVEAKTLPLAPKKLSPDVVALLLRRLADEYTAHYFYTCLANWCNEKGYFKAGAFFSSEANSELEHAKGIQEYLVSWNIIPEIPAVQTNHMVTNLVDGVNKAYGLEFNLLESYKDDAKRCILKDMNTFAFIQKYIALQNDSVKEFADLLNVLELLNLSEGDYAYKVKYFNDTAF